MAYRYIERTYGTTFKPGDRVKHTVTNKTGEIRRASGDPQYYNVRFDGLDHNRPCHPDELVAADQ